MKKILSLVLVLVFALGCFAACGKTEEKAYTLSVAVDDGFTTIGKGNKVTAIAVALVLDAEGKIAAARFDSVQTAFTADASRVDTKVELGDAYTGMSASWANEAAAFEAFLVGKTPAEIAALEFVVDGADAGLVAGCTMRSSMPVFKALVAKAAAYERKVEFKTNDAITLGLAIDTKVTAESAKIASDIAAVVVAGDKVAAAMLDSAEATYALGEDEKYTANYKGSKNEQGDAYDAYSPMASGRWYQQAQAFANTAVGKTVAELSNLSTDKIEGSCSIYTGGYKAVIVRAAGYAK